MEYCRAGRTTSPRSSDWSCTRDASGHRPCAFRFDIAHVEWHTAPIHDIPMRTVFVAPPPCKPSEPALSGGAAAEVFRRLGGDGSFIDASIGWHRFALEPERLSRIVEDAVREGREAGALTAYRAAIRSLREHPVPLRRAETYADRRVYTSAVAELDNALRIAALPYAGVRLGVAMVALVEPTRRLESSAVLEESSVVRGPFDDYLIEELLPRIEASGAECVAVSLTFQQQAVAAMRLGRLLRERMPSVRRVIGGPLVASWRAVGIDLERAPFTLFDRVVAGDDRDLAELVRDTNEGWEAAGDALEGGLLSPGLGEVPWGDYLAPMPVVPAAIGRGCYWSRCTFCPDHVHGGHRPCAQQSVGPWLDRVAERFPSGAMLHLTDSALPVEHLVRIAGHVAELGLPLRWHGFARVERAFAEPEVARLLAAGGCAMLQFGVETASLRMHERLGKGAGPERARQVLRATSSAGIRTHVYLLFGLPGETDDDREETLRFVEQEADSISAINASLLNLPKGSPMHREPGRHGITTIEPFHGDTDLSLYDDFRCGGSHPRTEARRWLEKRFLRSERVKAIVGRLRSPFKANHLCFLDG